MMVDLDANICHAFRVRCRPIGGVLVWRLLHAPAIPALLLAARCVTLVGQASEHINSGV